ncbi:MAG: hypothetical protein HQL87_09050 [Magnetococcales bacterium]|nr:hypothetical protein [Magnetococcales bacterium]
MTLLLTACAGGKGMDDPTFQTLFDKGRAYLERDNVAMALPALQQANQLQPGHVELLTLLGVAYDRAGRPVQALDALEEAHRLQPADGNLNNDLGVARLRLYAASCAHGEETECQTLLDQAEVSFQAALQDPALHLPEDVWFNLALLYKQRAQERAMVTALEKALAISSHHLPAQLELAEYAHQKGYLDLERQLLRRALATYPDHLVVLKRLVNSFLGTPAQDAPSSAAGVTRLSPDLSPGERAEVRSFLVRILAVAPETDAAQRASQQILLLDGK